MKFQNIKVGDKVLKQSGVFENSQILIVERVTNTQFIAGNGQRFRKKDGRIVGSDGYGYSRARILTEELYNELIEEKRRRKIERKLLSYCDHLANINKIRSLEDSQIELLNKAFLDAGISEE